MKAIKDQSYGIVPIFRKDTDYLFLLVKHRSGGHWAFPKGHRDKSETILETAKRELSEETGITDCSVPQEITFEEHYNFERDGKHVDKTVTYFLGFLDCQKMQIPDKFRPEIQDVKWVTYNEALKLLTYNEAKSLLRKVRSFLTKL